MPALNDVWDMYILYHRAQNHSPATLRWYEDVKKHLLRFFGEEASVQEMADRYAEFAVHLAAQGLSSGAVGGYLRGARALLRWCEQEGFVRLPPRLPAYRERQRVPEPLTDEQVQRLIAALPPPDGFLHCRDRIIVFLMLDSAVRLGELTRIRVEDLSLPDREIRILGKGNRERIIPVGDTLAQELRRYLVWRKARRISHPYLLTTRCGRPITTDAVRLLIRRLREELGFPLHPHKLRHTAAMNMIAGGADAFSVQAILGHSTPAMTARYVHATRAKLGKRHREWSPLDRHLRR